MLNIIAGILVIMFAVVGFVTCIKGLVNIIFMPKAIKTTIIIDTENLGCDDIEYAVRSIVQKIRYSPNQSFTQIAISDKNMNSESREICRRLCKEYSFVHIESDINSLEKFFRNSS